MSSGCLVFFSLLLSAWLVRDQDLKELLSVGKWQDYHPVGWWEDGMRARWRVGRRGSSGGEPSSGGQRMGQLAAEGMTLGSGSLQSCFVTSGKSRALSQHLFPSLGPARMIQGLATEHTAFSVCWLPCQDSPWGNISPILVFFCLVALVG